MQFERGGARVAKFVLSAALLASMGAVAAVQAADFGGSIKDDYAPEPVAMPKHWYVSIQGGANFIVDDVGYSNGPRTVDTDFDTGFNIGAAFGYRWHNVKLGGLVPRTEVEVSYSENEVDSLDFSGNGPGNELLGADSQISSVNVLFNLFFDAKNALGRGITPYFGGGIGLSVINHDILYGNAINFSDDDTAFAWHVTAGVDIAVSDSVSLFTDVGYHQVVDAGSERRAGRLSIPGVNGGRFEDDIDAVVVRSGLRVNF